MPRHLTRHRDGIGVIVEVAPVDSSRRASSVSRTRTCSRSPLLFFCMSLSIPF